MSTLFTAKPPFASSDIGDLFLNDIPFGPGSGDPPTQMSIIDRAANYSWQGLRTSSAIKIKSGQGDATILLSIPFKTDTVVTKGLSTDNKSITKLIRLIAELKTSPFVYVNNQTIRQAIGGGFSTLIGQNMALTIINVAISYNESTPDILWLNLTASLFNYSPFSQNFLFANEVKEGGKTVVSPVNSPGMSSRFLEYIEEAVSRSGKIGSVESAKNIDLTFNFIRAFKTIEEAKQAGYSVINNKNIMGFNNAVLGMQANSIRVDDYREKLGEALIGPPAVVPLGFTVSYSHILSVLPLVGERYYTQQYFGKSDVNIEVVFEVDTSFRRGEDFVNDIVLMRSTTEKNSAKYPQIPTVSFITVTNEIASLVGANLYMVENVQTETVPGRPDIIRMTLSLTSVDPDYRIFGNIFVTSAAINQAIIAKLFSGIQLTMPFFGKGLNPFKGMTVKNLVGAGEPIRRSFTEVVCNAIRKLVIMKDIKSDKEVFDVVQKGPSAAATIIAGITLITENKPAQPTDQTYLNLAVVYRDTFINEGGMLGLSALASTNLTIAEEVSTLSPESAGYNTISNVQRTFAQHMELASQGIVFPSSKKLESSGDREKAEDDYNKDYETARTYKGKLVAFGVICKAVSDAIALTPEYRMTILSSKQDFKVNGKTINMDTIGELVGTTCYPDLLLPTGIDNYMDVNYPFYEKTSGYNISGVLDPSVAYDAIQKGMETSTAHYDVMTKLVQGEVIAKEKKKLQTLLDTLDQGKGTDSQVKQIQQLVSISESPTFDHEKFKGSYITPATSSNIELSKHAANGIDTVPATGSDISNKLFSTGDASINVGDTSAYSQKANLKGGSKSSLSVNTIQYNGGTFDLDKEIKKAADDYIGTSIPNAWLYVKALLYQESSFNANAGANSGGAKGIAQFTKSTWLQVTKDTKHDNALNPYKAVPACARYLSSFLTSKAGGNNIRAALQGYHSGPAYLNRLVSVSRMSANDLFNIYPNRMNPNVTSYSFVNANVAYQAYANSKAVLKTWINNSNEHLFYIDAIEAHYKVLLGIYG